MDGVSYTIALSLVALIALVATRAHLALSSARSRSTSAAGPGLDLYEAAYLAGGPRRVINTALVSLAAQGGVRVSSEGVVTPVQGFRPNKRVRIERAVHRQVKGGSGGATAAEVRHGAGDAEALRSLATNLTRQGYLMSPAARVRARRRTSLLVLLTVLAMIAAAAVGAMNGPDGAVAIAAVAAVAAYVCSYVFRRRLADPLTVAGRVALERADTGILATGEWHGSEDIGPGDIGGVALHGLTKVPDRRLADTLRRDTRARTRSRAACCAPGRCGAYGSMNTPVFHGGGSCGAGCGGGGFFDFGGSTSHSGGDHGGSDFGGGDSGGGGGVGGCGGGGCGGGGT